MADHHTTADEVLSDLESAFRSFEQQVPPPQRVKFKDGFVVRYVERLPHQALVLKFARQISGMHALKLLLDNGFCQEQGVIQRTLDEFAEDIIFLALGLTAGPWTNHHNAFLKCFWADEYVGEEVGLMLPRKHIRAFNNRAGGLPDPSSADAVGKHVFRAYSGYVHGAAVNTLDMCGSSDLKLELKGMKGSPLYNDHVRDFWNYLYRGIASASFIATAFGNVEHRRARYEAVCDFESRFGDMILSRSS